MAGALATLWITRYTNWFATVGGVVSVAAVVSWLALLGKFLPEDQAKEVQKRWTDAVFLRKRTLGVTLLLWLGLAVLSCFWGAFEIVPGDGAEREVVIKDLHNQELERHPVRETTRILVLTSWWKPAKRKIKVSGYPTVVREVGPFDLVRLRLPESFVQRLVLVRPSAACLQDTLANPRPITVKIGETVITKAGYRGEPYWLSADADLEVPAALVEAWRAELRVGAEAVAGWRHPGALLDAEVSLSPGAEVTVHVEGREPVRSRVAPLGMKASEYIQEVVVP